MSFTKVAPAGIGTEPGTTLRLGDSLLHSTGLDIGVGSGIGVTIRQHGDATFTGIITASAFFGDGSGLEGVSSSGIGTPLSDDDTSTLNKAYYVNQELSIGSTVTVNHPSSAVASYTHYQDIVVTDDADFIVADGDTFIPDVLGINTSTLPNAVSSATGGRIRAGTITNAGANGAPNFPNGLTGTAGTFTGAISAASASITGNLGVGGVLTYEDVTNIDSIGIITARSTVSIADSIVHTGDTDTSLRFPSANTITAQTGGVERFRIDSNGSVRVGDNSSYTANANADNLVVGNTNSGNNNGISIISHTNSEPRLIFASNADDDAGMIKYAFSSNIMQFYTSGTERLRIDSNGYITKPNHPSFHARRVNNASSTTNPLVFDSVPQNNGSHYKSTGTDQGKFVAPVAGVYLFYWCAIKTNNGSVCRLYINVNNSHIYSNMHLRLQESGTYSNGSMQAILNLSSGDKVHISLEAGSIHGNEYTHFGGYLIH